MTDPRAYVCAAEVALLLPEAQTLKDRRSVVKSLTERLSRRFNLSVADLDGGQRAANWAKLGIAAVSNSPAQARQCIDAALRFLDEADGADLLSAEFLEM